MGKLIVGLTGPAGAGKSTVASMLLRMHPGSGAIIGFADPMRNFMADLGVDPFDRAKKEEPSDLLCGKSPRFAMQTLGTEWGRDTIGRDLWVNSWRWRAVNNPYDIVLVEDVRFRNEAEAVKGLGGWVVKVDGRGGIPGTHRSETELSDIAPDYYIDNSGSIEDLRGAVEELFMEIM